MKYRYIASTFWHLSSSGTKVAGFDHITMWSNAGPPSGGQKGTWGSGIGIVRSLNEAQRTPEL